MTAPTVLPAESLPAWRRYLAYTTVALMPISINVEKLVGARSRTYFSPLDLLLPVLLVLLISDLLRRKSWANFKWPPLPGVLWAGVALLSAVFVVSSPHLDALKAFAKGPFFWGVAAVCVFQNIVPDPAEFRRLLLILGASVGVCLLLALKQYAGPVGLPYDPETPLRELGGASHIRVGGWYDFRAILGAQMALLAPAAAAFALLDKDSAVRWAAFAFALLALCVTLSAGGFLGACAGIIAVAGAYALQRSWLTGVTALALLLAVIAVVLPRLPRQNGDVLLRGVAFFAKDGQEMKATARLRRYQAELDLLASRPRDQTAAPRWQTGVGLDQFQGQVNGFYDKEYHLYPKPSSRTDAEADFDMDSDEPFTFGLLETVTVELGVAGLLAILFLFGTWIGGAYSGWLCSRNEDSTRSLLALASLGAGVGALVLSVFGNPAIRGIGGSFALFYALALVSRKWISVGK